MVNHFTTRVQTTGPKISQTVQKCRNYWTLLPYLKSPWKIHSVSDKYKHAWYWFRKFVKYLWNLRMTAGEVLKANSQTALRQEDESNDDWRQIYAQLRAFHWLQINIFPGTRPWWLFISRQKVWPWAVPQNQYIGWVISKFSLLT